jgi:hypothetical protein
MALYKGYNFNNPTVMRQVDLAVAENFKLMESERLFDYVRLLPRQIRLFVLRPSSTPEESIIEAFIIHSSLDNPLPYNALSYTWGKPDPDRPSLSKE